MAFGPAPLPDLSRLKILLLNSGIQKKNNALYQVIDQLIDFVSRSDSIIVQNISGSGGSISVLASLDFLTHSDESVDLPNSRRLLAGTNITFNDTIVNKRTINATTPNREWSVLTDGDLLNPELIFASGEVVMISVP